MKEMKKTLIDVHGYSDIDTLKNMEYLYKDVSYPQYLQDEEWLPAHRSKL